MREQTRRVEKEREREREREREEDGEEAGEGTWQEREIRRSGGQGGKKTDKTE